MVTAREDHELEMDYEVTYREMQATRAPRDVSSRDRFRAQSRYSRGGKGRMVAGAHRRRDKRNYL